MKRPTLSCALTGLCLVLGGLAQGPTIGPCGAPNTTENFNGAYISKLDDDDYLVLVSDGQLLYGTQLKFFPNGTYIHTYIDRAGRSAQHTGEYRAQAHAASAPATITLHSLPAAAFGGGSGSVTFSVIKAEDGALELISCISEGLLHRENRHVLISTTLLRSIMNVGLREVLRTGSEVTASPRQSIFDYILGVPKAVLSASFVCLYILFGMGIDQSKTCVSFFTNFAKSTIFPPSPQALLYYTDPAVSHSVPTLSLPHYPVQHSGIVHPSTHHYHLSPSPAPEVVSVPYSAQLPVYFENHAQNALAKSPIITGNPFLGQYNIFFHG
ncbi:uncharacterized protein LOC108678355 [Hyalella azteca]|uniref:Uncharacterized protein LOC108678355 n=1 Tax=Hyalella azteca TaxID=294128 RepID=A0A8B7P7T5_HYAAZ|nr:uncharacterized protein LOC108678355 [Hyalella azteca]